MSLEVSTTAAALKATVAICAFNAANRIGKVLQALASQNLKENNWEILVVDNASSDDTGGIVRAQAKMFSDGRLRVVREELPGLSHARQRAAAEARGEIICFLDDDNIAAPDFVASAIAAFSNRPRVGALGGKVIAAWETPPSELAVAVQNFALAIVDLGNQAFAHPVNVGPVGAGLCIRTALLREIYRQEIMARSAVGHKGGVSGGGDDLAICILAWQLGFECWYEPSLVIHHQLPARRMEKSYLLKLYEGIGRGQAEVRRLYDWKARTPLTWLLGLKDYLRWLTGAWRGPSREFRERHPGIAVDLHDLNQRLLWSRSIRALQLFPG